MKHKLKYYKCEICGNISTKLVDKGPHLSCCNQVMKLLEPNKTDGATEKHLPVFEKVDGVEKIKISSVQHPMLDEHFIEFIVADTDGLTIFKKLNPGEEPSLTFELEDIKDAYEYCNLHGLWKSEK